MGTVTFDPKGALGFGPLRYHNFRDGGYVQLAYRPTQVENDILKNIELVGRFDMLHVPGAAPGIVSDRNYTFGVDYWLGPAVVIKTAYTFDDPERGKHQNVFQIQAAVGF